MFSISSKVFPYKNEGGKCNSSLQPSCASLNFCDHENHRRLGKMQIPGIKPSRSRVMSRNLYIKKVSSVDFDVYNPDVLL